MPIINIKQKYDDDDDKLKKKKIKIIPKKNDNTTVSDNTNIKPIVDKSSPNDLNDYFRNKSYLRNDTRTPDEKEISKKYTEEVLNPSFGQQMLDATSLPLRYLANPLKLLGDITNTIAPNSNINRSLPNTGKDLLENRRIQLNPSSTRGEKLNNTVTNGLDLTANALTNVGIGEFGYMLPKSTITPSMKSLFEIGSKGNFGAGLLQLSKTDIDKVKQGDIAEILGTLANGGGLLSKLDNFDASGIYNNVRNWNNISSDLKYDTYKDIVNLIQTSYQQTQRN